MTERTYHPFTILKRLLELTFFLENISHMGDDLEAYCNRYVVPKENILLGFKLVRSFCYFESELSGLAPLATFTDDPYPDLLTAASFLKGEMALYLIESEMQAYDYGEIDISTYYLYPLSVIRATRPLYYQDWVRDMINPVNEYLQDLAHDEFMNDWTNFS